MVTNSKFKARRGVEVRKCLMEKKNSKLVWKDEQEFDRKIRGDRRAVRGVWETASSEVRRGGEDVGSSRCR